MLLIVWVFHVLFDLFDHGGENVCYKDNEVWVWFEMLFKVFG